MPPGEKDTRFHIYSMRRKPMKIACGYTIPITLFGIPPTPADHLKAMEIVGQNGFKAIELELYDELVAEHRRDLPAMKAILARYGMTVPSVMAVEEKMFSLDPALKEKAIHDFEHLAEMTAELGTPLIAICGYMPPEIRPQGTELYVGGPPTAVEVSEDIVKQFAAIAARHGLTLIIETRANDVFSSTDAVLNLIRETGANNMGIILDVAHVHAGKEYLSLVIPKLGRLIRLVHFSDNDGTQAYHYPLGKGKIDFKSVIRALGRAGFDDTIVVDISGGANIVAEAIKAREFIQRLIDENAVQ
jgi:sugar phosphate isomerase/epimerase